MRSCRVPLLAAVLALAPASGLAQTAPPPLLGTLPTTVAPAVRLPGAPPPAPADAADQAAPAAPIADAVPAVPQLDPVNTGAVPPVPGTNPRVRPVPMIDSSDPAAGIVAGNALRRTADPNPYEPLGIRTGSFVWLPSVTLSGGYTTNATNSAGGKSSGFGIVAPELLINSDWSRHALSLALRGSYTSFTRDDVPDDPTAEATLAGRIDFAERWTGDLGAYYRYAREGAGDPNAPAAADSPADINRFGASAGLNGAWGWNVFTLATTVDRSLYGDTSFNGVSIDQSDRDNTVYGARLRVGYPLTGAITPFVEGIVTRRQYDDTVDDNGLRRSSTGSGVRVGVALDRGPVTTGEVAIGYLTENYDDSALETLSAFTVDGSLVWAPTELVTVTTALATTIDPSTDPVSSGSVIYDGSVDLAYAWRTNAAVTLSGGVKNQQFEGLGRNDRTYRLGIGTTWSLNRNAELAAGYVHQWLDSTVAANDYTSDTLRIDLKLRH